MDFAASEIRRLIDSGMPASDIAVIASKHKILESLVPFLSMRNIPVNYEREQNVLEEIHVRQLIQMIRFVSSLGRKNEEADDLLPEILSYPFWNIERKIIWEISLKAGQRKWLEFMIESEDRKLRDIAEFFIDLGIRSQNEPLEWVIDRLIGSDIISAVFDENDDVIMQKAAPDKPDFTSPFKEYYFNRELFEKNRSVYMLFLDSLLKFVQALREHKHGMLLFTEDLLSFVDLHDKNNIQVTNKSSFVSNKNSVSLLTAHKAKGMEFDTVFVLSCQDDVWAGRGKSSLLSFPKNLPLAPAGNTLDDHLRLFYVAITRAKRRLYLTSYLNKKDGKESLPLQFLVSENMIIHKGEETETSSNESLLFSSWKAVLTPPFVADEKALLRSRLEEYQMSATHLNTFLDVVNGGPQIFLEHNFLRFPSAKIPAVAYGSAMHHALEKVYVFLKKEGNVPFDKIIMGWFEESLKHERLSPRDFQFWLKRGRDALSAYLKERKGAFEITHKSETDFSHQGAILGEARITGKIDKMIPRENGIMSVVYFKTGKTYDEWDKGTPEEKIKLYKYRRQLVFYKLLVENSRDYSKYRVEEGALEFLEPDKKGKIHELVANITEEETARTKALIEAVYKKIINLDLPDISQYPKDLSGIIAFEDDLTKQ
jgi:DNA helicase-2/ATP-dependent DNA helicase PcrA